MKAIGFAILLVGASTAAANASIVQISSPSELSPFDTVNWGVFGAPPTTVFTFAQEPVGPLVVHINTAGGELNVEPGSAVGGFLSTDTLLSQVTGDLSDPVLVGFSVPVRGVGTQLESLLPGAFTGYMDLYNASSSLLGEVSVNANTTTAEDGSAPFIGAISNTDDIDYVIFSVNNGDPLFPKAEDVAINALDFAVPEPLTLSLFGAGLAGAVVMRRSKKKAAASAIPGG